MSCFSEQVKIILAADLGGSRVSGKCTDLRASGEYDEIWPIHIDQQPSSSSQQCVCSFCSSGHFVEFFIFIFFLWKCSTGCCSLSTKQNSQEANRRQTEEPTEGQIEGQMERQIEEPTEGPTGSSRGTYKAQTDRVAIPLNRVVE